MKHEKLFTRSYQAEAGMSWDEWFDSKYNDGVCTKTDLGNGRFYLTCNGYMSDMSNAAGSDVVGDISYLTPVEKL